MNNTTAARRSLLAVVIAAGVAAIFGYGAAAIAIQIRSHMIINDFMAAVLPTGLGLALGITVIVGFRVTGVRVSAWKPALAGLLGGCTVFLFQFISVLIFGMGILGAGIERLALAGKTIQSGAVILAFVAVARGANLKARPRFLPELIGLLVGTVLAFLYFWYDEEVLFALMGHGAAQKPAIFAAAAFAVFAAAVRWCVVTPLAEGGAAPGVPRIRPWFLKPFVIVPAIIMALAAGGGYMAMKAIHNARRTALRDVIYREDVAGLNAILAVHPEMVTTPLIDDLMPLDAALAGGKLPIVQTLVKYGAAKGTAEGQFAWLGTAALHGDVQIFRLLCDQTHIDIRTLDKNHSFELLSLAVDSQNPGMVIWLLDAGVHVDEQQDYSGTVLHQAAGSGIYIAKSSSVKIAAVLIKAGAKVNALMEYTGQTPLHVAVERVDEAMVKLLLENGADAKIKDKSGKIAKDILAEHPNTAIAAMLAKQS